MPLKQPKTKVLQKVKYTGSTMLSPLRLKIKYFKQKVPLQVDCDPFIIKTAANGSDLKKILKLRYRVFYKELLNHRVFFGIDIDRFDFMCDHLMIIDKRVDRCVGTYRFTPSHKAKHFYSETEFKIKEFVALPEAKLELGRACIEKAYRDGEVINLLWRGIAEYSKQTGAKYLFGCSSIKTTDPLDIAMVVKYVRENVNCRMPYPVVPKRKFRVKNLDLYLYLLEQYPERYDKRRARRMIPSLLKSYLRAGAMVAADPALDRSFKCIDLFTILDFETLTDRLRKRYAL